MEEKNMQNEGQEGQTASQDAPQAQEAPQATPQEQSAPQAEQSDSSSDNGKIWGIIGYLFPIIFFIPLVIDGLKENPYSKFHANQQLVLLISWIVVNVVGGILPIIGWFLILPIGTIILIVLTIIGIINAAKGSQKKLPMIGGITIIK